MEDDSRLIPEGCALVVGGSGGIGSVVAKEFARAGSLVAIADRRNRDKAEAIVAVLEKIGVRASSQAVSVGDRQQVNDVFAAAA